MYPHDATFIVNPATRVQAHHFIDIRRRHDFAASLAWGAGVGGTLAIGAVVFFPAGDLSILFAYSAFGVAFVVGAVSRLFWSTSSSSLALDHPECFRAGRSLVPADLSETLNDADLWELAGILQKMGLIDDASVRRLRSANPGRQQSQWRTRRAVR